MGKITAPVVSKAHSPLGRFQLQPFILLFKQKQNHIKLEPDDCLLKPSLAAAVRVFSECQPHAKMLFFDACSKCFLWSLCWGGGRGYPTSWETGELCWRLQGQNSLGTWAAFLRISTGSKGKKENHNLLLRKCPYKGQIPSLCSEEQIPI